MVEILRGKYKYKCIICCTKKFGTTSFNNMSRVSGKNLFYCSCNSSDWPLYPDVLKIEKNNICYQTKMPHSFIKMVPAAVHDNLLRRIWDQLARGTACATACLTAWKKIINRSRSECSVARNRFVDHFNKQMWHFCLTTIIVLIYKTSGYNDQCDGLWLQ